MNPGEDQFDSLRRLLALKRHEAPPPGYFGDFSQKVIAGIQAQEQQVRRPSSNAASQAPWLVRLWQAFETRPALSGAFGVVASLAMVAALVFGSEPPDSSSTGAGSLASAAMPDDSASADPAAPFLPVDFTQPRMSSLGTGALLFDDSLGARVEPISFGGPGH